jgi:predicted O-methyltransferase YrrM
MTRFCISLDGCEATVELRGPLAQQGFDESFTTLERTVRAVARPGMQCLEIGTWLGNSAIRTGRVCQEFAGRLFCVDWWRGSAGVALLEETAAEHDIFALFLDNVARAGLDETIVPLRMRSADAAPVLADRQFDHIFIDGDHRYAAVKADIAAFCDKVRPGGILCGHDCLARYEEFDPALIESNLEHNHISHPDLPGRGLHPGVVKAVHEAFGPHYQVENEVWWVHAPPVGGPEFSWLDPLEAAARPRTPPNRERRPSQDA